MGRTWFLVMAFVVVAMAVLTFLFSHAHFSRSSPASSVLLLATAVTVPVTIGAVTALAVIFLFAREGAGPRLLPSRLSFDARVFLVGLLCSGAGQVMLEHFVAPELHSVLAPVIAAVVALSMVSLWVAVRVHRRWNRGGFGLPRLAISFAMAGLSAVWCIGFVRQEGWLGDSLTFLSILLVPVYIGAWSLRILSFAPSAFPKHWPADKQESS